MFSAADICSGEKIQQLCDVYCGSEFHFHRNPKITAQPEKHMYIDQLHAPWDNPRRIFCYLGNDIRVFMSKLQFLKNEFILVSHNEDLNITDEFYPILEHPLCKHWFTQNAMIRHEKLTSIPIGVANEMWTQGNLHKIVEALVQASNNVVRPIDFYFNFALWTNQTARTLCKNVIESKGLQFVDYIPFEDYLRCSGLSKFIISPPGNGVDCHRIWESYYLGTIPILLRSVFTEQLSETFPCIILDKWEDFDRDACLAQYDTLREKLLTVTEKLKFSYYKDMILRM